MRFLAASRHAVAVYSMLVKNRREGWWAAFTFEAKLLSKMWEANLIAFQQG
jgi:hypothetical protein